MRWIEKQARYCQGYLADECTLIPVAILTTPTRSPSGCSRFLIQ